MEKIVVAYVCDKKYIPYLTISMKSIQRYNKNVEFVVLSKEKFEVPNAKVYQINTGTIKFKFKQNDRMGDGVYYKFWLPTLPYDKILYIDCDVICQRPLKSLWEQKCDFICATESHAYGKIQAKELGLQKYALSGMMLMNLKALREMNFTEECLKMLSKINPRFHDETVINLLLSKKIQFIDKKYNYCHNRKYDDPIAESDAYLLHYVGAAQKTEMLRRKNFESLDKVKEMLCGKSVAIVGNSERILKSRQGKAIDSHDIVIRFNKGFPREEVGYKTDIVFCACTLNNAELKKYNGAHTIKRSIYCKHKCEFSIDVYDRIQLEQRVTSAVTANNRYNKTSQPSTGFIAINFALSCNCKNIDLYGFDFFENPTYYNPKYYKTLHNGSDEGDKVREYAACGLLKIN